MIDCANPEQLTSPRMVRAFRNSLKPQWTFVASSLGLALAFLHAIGFAEYGRNCQAEHELACAESRAPLGARVD